MKTICRLIVGVFLSGMVISCFTPPEYPIVPEIEFKSIKFVDTPDPAGQLIADTLILSVDFKDGDGDIGFSDADLQLSQETLKYAEHFYYDNKGTAWALADPTALSKSTKPDDIAFFKSLLKYSSKKTAPFDTLPNFVKPFNCINWNILTDETKDGAEIDTLYFQLNPNYYNIFVDFFVNNNGTFEEYDFRKEFCTTYDGRLPILSKDISQQNPLQGTIRYAMTGIGFKLYFTNKTVKLRVRIQDRNLNKSNQIETPSFTLNSIK